MYSDHVAFFFLLLLPIAETTGQVLSPTAAMAMGLPASDVHLKSKPHLAILYEELLSVASQWQDIGTLLGLDPDDCSTIKSDEGDVRSCLRGMLTFWLKQIDPPPTKSKIITVLKKLNLNEKAQGLDGSLTR